MSAELGLLLEGGLGAALFLTALWAVQLRTRDAGISDFGWAAALGGLTVYYALQFDAGWPGRRAAVYAPLLVLGLILGLSGSPPPSAGRS